MKPAAASTPVSGGGGGWDPSDMIGSILEGETKPGRTTQDPAETRTVPVDTKPASETPLPAEPGSATADNFVPPPSAIPEGLLPGGTTPVRQPAPVAGKDADDPADPPDPVEITQGSAKGKNAWSQIKAEKKQLSQQLKEYQQKLKDAETRLAQSDQTKPPEMQKVLEMQKQIEAYEDQLGKLDVTQTRAFKARFDIPMERTLKRGEALLQRTGLQPKEASELMGKLVSADAHQASELIADLPVPVQGALFTLTTELSQMATDRTDAISNWKQTKLALNENEVREQEYNIAQTIEKDTAEALQAALKDGNWMYATGDNLPPEWNAGVAKRIDTVKGILRTAKPAELVKWVIEGQTARELRAMLAQENERANKLAQELALRTNMRPRLGGGSPGQPGSPEPAKPVSPGALIDRLFQ